MTCILTDLKKNFKSKKFCKICGHNSLRNVQPVLSSKSLLWTVPPPSPKKVATVERWPLGEFRLYTQRPTRAKATGKISELTKLSETRELKKKMKEIKREREKVGKTQKQI